MWFVNMWLLSLVAMLSGWTSGPGDPNRVMVRVRVRIRVRVRVRIRVGVRARVRPEAHATIK